MKFQGKILLKLQFLEMKKNKSLYNLQWKIDIPRIPCMALHIWCFISPQLVEKLFLLNDSLCDFLVTIYFLVVISVLQCYKTDIIISTGWYIHIISVNEIHFLLWI